MIRRSLGSDVEEVLKNVDVFLPNEHEACRVAGTSDVERRSTPCPVSFPLSSSSVARRRAGQTRNERFGAASLPFSLLMLSGRRQFQRGDSCTIHSRSGLQDCLEYGNVAAGLSTTRAGGTEGCSRPPAP